MIDTFKSIDFLQNNYKKIVDIYFKDKTGKFIINDNILEIDFDDWGKEYFYFDYTNNDIVNNNTINNNTVNNNESINKSIYYDIKYNRIKNIYSIAVLVQIGNWNVFKKMEDYINNFKNISINIYFFIINEYATDFNINYLKHKYKDCVIASCENKGMDIGPFLLNLHYIKTRHYNHEYIFKLHTKSSDIFRNDSLNILINSHDNILENIKKLSISKTNTENGIFAGNIIYKYNNFKEAFQSNLYHIRNLIKYLYNEEIIYDKLEFVAGTMFISKLKIFNILSPLKILEIYEQLNTINTLDYHWYSLFYKIDVNDKKRIYYDYNNYKINRYPNNLNYSLKTNTDGLRDSMIEHAFERVIGYICKKQELEIIE
jgi:hypothetical protein